MQNQLLKYTSTSNAIKKGMIEITLSSTFLLSCAANASFANGFQKIYKNANIGSTDNLFMT